MKEINNTGRGQRKLKVYYRSVVQKTISIFIPRPYKDVPEIRLCGNWLKDIGFDSGQLIMVTHEMNKIVITLREEPPTNQNLNTTSPPTA